MRYFVLGVILALTVAAPARADTGLTAALAAAYLPRTVDAGLHAIAHERVLEISSCEGCMTHDLMRPGTAEVLGYNAGYADPIATVIAAWAASPPHDAILSDGGWGRIGCAERSVNGKHWFACVLAAGGGGSTSSTGTTGATGPPITLPDTAMH
jgi:hypothetical protein